MKSKNILQLITAVFIMGCLSASCVKEGPMGPAGENGINGTNGLNGADGSVTCLACHSGTNMDQKKAEFVMSAHSVGAIAVDYAGGRASCAPCHSHEQFVEYSAFGLPIAGDITNPTAWKCSTCHGLHKTFETKDYAFRVNGPVAALYDKTQKLDVKGNSNLCVVCHQTRRPEPNKDIPGATYRISNSHYGPHHGPQGNVLAGVGFAEIPGSVAYPTAGSAVHLTQASCVGCHMSKFSSEKNIGSTNPAMVNRGGHSFIPSVTACNSCHGGTPINDYNYGGVQSDIHAKLEQLRDKLVELGVVEYVAADAAYEPKAGTYPMLHVQAYFNWIGLEEDRSLGVHNPKYVRALLVNTLEALNKK